MLTSNEEEHSASAASTSMASPPATPYAAAASTIEQEIAACPKCGRDVPVANMVLHEAKCGRIRPSNNNTPQVQSGIEEGQSHSQQQQLPEPELSQTPQLLPQRERGQQTLDRWLSTASSSDDRSGSASRRSSGVGNTESSNNDNFDPNADTEDRSSGNGAATTNSSSNEESATSEAAALSSSNVGSSDTANSDANSESYSSHNLSGSASSSPLESNSTTEERNGNIALDSDTANVAMALASFVDNIQPPSQIQSSTEAQETYQTTSGSNATAAADDGQNVQLEAGQWQCSRCTLINESSDSRCNACASPRDTNDRPPNPPINERLVQHQENSHGWVNVTYNPQFRRGPSGITRVNNPPPPFYRVPLPQNPLVHNNGRISMAARAINGLVNGAIVGFTLFEVPGAILGGFLGIAGGIAVDRSRNAQEEAEETATQQVANMLANDHGGIQPGTVRVHRGGGYVTALASDAAGRQRVIRVRYAEDPSRQQQQLPPTGEINNMIAEMRGEIPPAARGIREEVEQSLLEILVQMSYSRDFGPGPGNNVILQPEESFEELIRRFGLGNGHRGASQEVIDSFPTEIVRRNDDRAEEDGQGGGDENEEDDSSQKSGNGDNDDNESIHSDDRSSELGTCGICLEDYHEGEITKTLSCPNHPHCFHKDCIDKWLKRVASCPICKNDVRMYNMEPTAADAGT